MDIIDVFVPNAKKGLIEYLMMRNYTYIKMIFLTAIGIGHLMMRQSLLHVIMLKIATHKTYMSA